MTRLEPEPEPEPVERAELAAVLAEGVAHFDAGRYHAAHESFERLWVSGAGPDEDFYKGLVQAAICLHHLRRGELDGAVKLHAGMRRLLAPFLPTHAGLDVQRFLEDMQRTLRPAVRGEAVSTETFTDGVRPRLER